MKGSILLTLGSGCGGAERMTILYGKILQKAGFNIHLLVCNSRTQQVHPLSSIIPEEWSTEVINGKFRSLPFRLLKSYRKTKADYIFASLPHYCQFAILFKLLHLVRSRIVVRENTSPTRKSRMRCFLCRLLYPHAYAVIAQTNEMKNEMTHFYNMKGGDIKVINNPLDKDQIDRKSKDIFKFDKQYTNYVSIGRLATPKDYPTLLNAFSIVHDADSATRLYIVGDCKNKSIKDELDAIIAKNHLADCVFFEGFQDNPYKYMKGCDVYCLSSSIEGLPNVLLESLYLQKPVVATRCIPFIQQVVHEGKNGYTCNVKDSIEFANCMQKAKELVGKNMEFDYDTNKDIINLFK